ncbi:NmrA/HSCARG family protein [Mycolicibacterium sp. P9-64]|uniref:NmrA/HSCARG family protein n=1 Tax=Mycolicibacterium sp. P9-64 TaxID=2024612 RepID=UPI0011EE0168|nr:NmrA/HSCARG family protein [Mycolicibacterium sp. P9-64]KAA0081688.1 NmrA/HSCARG family protein [Mycolicibacterium sp. P9-64]
MTTSTTKTIAVAGATGAQGGAVVDALLERGARVRALVRSTGSERARILSGRGVELVQIDAKDSASLRNALQGVDAFFFMTTPYGDSQNTDIDGEIQQGVDFVDAATAAEVPHVVFSSVGGAERHSGVPHFESKRRIEEHLLGSGLPATIVRPVFFMDNFLSMAPTVEGSELVLRLPFPDGIKLQTVAVRDIGVVVASALLDPAVVPAAIEIAGDELTGSEIAATFGAYVGLSARYEALPVEVLDGQDDLQKMFRWFADTPAYQADIAAVRRVDGDLWNLQTWLQSTNYGVTSS